LLHLVARGNQLTLGVVEHPGYNPQSCSGLHGLFPVSASAAHYKITVAAFADIMLHPPDGSFGNTEGRARNGIKGVEEGEASHALGQSTEYEYCRP
jgi:hypothetical protein